MTLADGTLAVFTLVNSLRFLAYLPQIAKALKDRSGAEAISFGTWTLFLASHASAMAYAIVNQGDWMMASLFLSNAIGCLAVLAIAGFKRSRHRRLKTDALNARAIDVIGRWHRLTSMDSNEPAHEAALRRRNDASQALAPRKDDYTARFP